jgi:purine-binding chemotaxis protein CheW
MRILGRGISVHFADDRAVVVRTFSPGGKLMSPTQTVLKRSQYLTFQLAGEEYGLDIMQVREIIEFGTLTRVPHTPATVRGVINLRGNVVPVIDLTLKFTGAPTAITRRSCIIIAEAVLGADRVVTGVIADAVSKVVELTDDEILPAPAFGTGVRVEYLLGMGRAGSKFLLLLDMDKVLSMKEATASPARNDVATANPMLREQGSTTGA